MLAGKAGTSKNTILSAEHGGDIRPTTARKIAEALDVEIDDLLGETESPLAEAAPSAEQPPLNGFLAEERREAATIGDQQWLRSQIVQRRVSIEIAGVPQSAEDIDADLAVLLAPHLRAALRDADVRPGDRVEWTIRLYDADGNEILARARSEAA